MKEAISIDSFYISSPNDKNQPRACKVSKINETELWHRNLGHLNLRSMRKTIIEKAIVGLPCIKIEEGKIYGDFLIGK